MKHLTTEKYKMNTEMITPKGYAIKGWNGNPIGYDSVVKWVDECIKTLVDAPDSDFTYTSSGDTLVFVVRDRHMNSFEVWVSKVVAYDRVSFVDAHFPEIGTKDAPVYMDLPQAEAFVNGYNTARDKILNYMEQNNG